MAAMGRPRKEIRETDFENLCQLQCTQTEISRFFRCSEDTIARWCKRTYGVTFAEAFKEFGEQGKISLRHYQFQLAKKNASMAIFLGKQYLGQSDTPVPDGDTEALQAISRLNQLFDKARKRYDKDADYDASAASSGASEQQGAERLDDLPLVSEAAPPAAKAAKPAKGKAPTRGESK